MCTSPQREQLRNVEAKKQDDRGNNVREKEETKRGGGGNSRRFPCSAARRRALTPVFGPSRVSSLLSANAVSILYFHTWDQKRSAVSLRTGRAFFCPLKASMSSGSSSSWWEGWSGTYHAWSDYPSPEPAAPESALDQRVTNTLHRVRRSCRRGGPKRRIPSER